MKSSKLTFAEGFLGLDAAAATKRGSTQKVFDWDEAARIIKEKLKTHPNLIAEAGLEGDWNYTGGTIFEGGNPTTEGYTYLASNWAIPTLILSWEGVEQQEIPCYVEESGSRFTCDSSWDENSLKILSK